MNAHRKLVDDPGVVAHHVGPGVISVRFTSGSVYIDTIESASDNNCPHTASLQTLK